MSSLVVFPLRFLHSMGIGGAFTALIAAGVALTLLPALFVLLGPRLGHVRPGPPGEGRWYALAHAVLRHPGAVALVTAAVMVAIALPALHTHWSGVDAHVLPSSASAHQVEDAVEREFPRVRSTPEFVAVRTPAADGATVRRLRGSACTHPGTCAGGRPALPGTRHLAGRSDARGRGDCSGGAAGDSAHASAGAVLRLQRGRGGRIGRRIHRPASSDRAVAAIRGGDPGGGHVGRAVADDGLARAAADGARHERAHRGRRDGPARADLPGRPPAGRARLQLASAESNRATTWCWWRSHSRSRPTTACSS